MKELQLLNDGSSRVIEFTDAEMEQQGGDPDVYLPGGGVLIPGDQVVGASAADLRDVVNALLGTENEPD